MYRLINRLGMTLDYVTNIFPLQQEL